MKQIIGVVLICGLAFSVVAEQGKTQTKSDTVKSESVQTLRKTSGTVPPATKTNWSKIKDMFH